MHVINVELHFLYFRRQTRKISVVSYAVKGNVLDLHLQFGLMKINIVN